MDRVPDSIPAAIQHIWSRLLFPSRGPTDVGPINPVYLVVLLIVPGLLLYPCLGFALFEPDESRYAQIPREMLQRGDVVLPTLQSQPYLDKPPLFYWLVLFSYQLFGVGAWQARLVPVLALHASLLAVYLLGRRSVGDRSAFVAALLLTLAPGYILTSRLLILDGLLTLCTTLTLLTALEAVRGQRFSDSWWFTSSLFCGLGILTKGPVILFLIAPPLVLFASVLTVARVGRYFGMALALSVPWFVALGVRQPEFVSYFFWEHNVQRFLAPGIHVRGVWFYGPVLVGLLLPVSLLAVPFTRFLLSRLDAPARTREMGFHWFSALWCVGFFTLSACKLPTYILPAMPSLALVVGVFVTRTGWDRSPAFVSVGLASFALTLGINLVALPCYANYRSPLSRPEAVVELCSDPAASVVCYPRNCDSVAFYLGRRDLRVFRSKDIEELRTLVRVQPRTVILCTHRSSLAGLKQLLPPEVVITREVRLGLRDLSGVPPWLMKPLRKIMGETALGLGDICVVEMPSLKERLLSKAPPASAGPTPPLLAVPGRKP